MPCRRRASRPRINASSLTAIQAVDSGSSDTENWCAKLIVGNDLNDVAAQLIARHKAGGAG